MQDGGDLLTKFRLQGAKELRRGNPNPADRFEHIDPITCEFFHLGMNFLEKIVFRRLWHEEAHAEVGTMKCAQQRWCRKKVSANVKKAYDPDKEFFLSFVRGYVIEGILEFFGMDDVNSTPTTNKPPDVFKSQQEMEKWVYNTLGQFVDEYVWRSFAGTKEEQVCVGRYRYTVVVNE